jgi:hypothetical protein
MAPGMGFALDDAIADNEADFGGLLSEHMRSKGADKVSQALRETTDEERSALASNLDQIESARINERSEDTRPADFQRAVNHELAQQHDACDAHAAEQTKLAYDQYRHRQEATEREQLIRQAERARLENQALRDMAFPEVRERQTEELNRQTLEMAEANLLPSELVRQGRMVEAIDRLSTYTLEASVQRQEMQLRQAITDDINRRMQVDPNTAAAVRHFADSLAREAQLVGADPAQYVRDGALQALAAGHRDGVSLADSLVRASRFRGYQTPAEINAWQEQNARARQQQAQAQREAEERQRQNLFKECRQTYENTRREARGRLMYDTQFMQKAKRSGFVRHLRGHMSSLY